MRPQQSDPMACAAVFIILVAVCLFLIWSLTGLTDWIMTQSIDKWSILGD